MPANPKPASVFSWATSPDPGRVVAPAPALVSAGYPFEGIPASDNINHIFNLLGQWTAYLDTLAYGGSAPITVGAPDAQTGVRPIGFSPSLTAHGLAAGAQPTAVWDVQNTRFDFGIPAGVRGKTVWSGGTSPAFFDIVGNGVENGDFYMDTAAVRLYGPYNAGWGAGVSLVGLPGTSGTPGAAGPSTIVHDLYGQSIVTLVAGGRYGVADRDYLGATPMTDQGNWNNRVSPAGYLKRNEAASAFSWVTGEADALWYTYYGQSENRIRRVRLTSVHVIVVQDLLGGGASANLNWLLRIAAVDVPNNGVALVFNAQGATYLYEGGTNGLLWTQIATSGNYVFWQADVVIPEITSAPQNGGGGAAEQVALAISLGNTSGQPGAIAFSNECYLLGVRTGGKTYICGQT